MVQNSIQINKLSIGYKAKNKENIVAKDLTATIRSGELTCLIGANGVGKSTLLKTLIGFQPSLAGEVLIKDKNIKTYSPKELSKLIGVVLTEKIEVRDMSVRELISLGRNPYTNFWGKLSQEDKQIIGEAIRLVNIQELANRSIETLSDGERQKVMIAKVIAQQTPVIILDEPTAFLDFPSKVEIMQLLNSLSKKLNKTIFLSSHDLELAIQVADIIWMMNKKTGIMTGSPQKLIEDGRLEKFFQCEGVRFDKTIGLFRIEKQV